MLVALPDNPFPGKTTFLSHNLTYMHNSPYKYTYETRGDSNFFVRRRRAHDGNFRTTYNFQWSETFFHPVFATDTSTETPTSSFRLTTRDMRKTKMKGTQVPNTVLMFTAHLSHYAPLHGLLRCVIKNTPKPALRWNFVYLKHLCQLFSYWITILIYTSWILWIYIHRSSVKTFP